MPKIILKKAIKRKYAEFEKVFPEGTEMFVSWDHYHNLVKENFCDAIQSEISKEIKLKKEIKKTTSKK